MSNGFASFLAGAQQALGVGSQVAGLVQAFRRPASGAQGPGSILAGPTPMSAPPLAPTSSLAVGRAPAAPMVLGAPVDRNVRLGDRGLRVYEAFRRADEGVSGSTWGELFAPGNLPEHYAQREHAKLVAQYGAIPADSDYGQLLVAAGARTRPLTVTYNDGTRERYQVIDVRGLLGRRRRRRSGIPTPVAIRNAARTMRGMRRYQRAFAKLQNMAARPKSARACPPPRRRRAC